MSTFPFLAALICVAIIIFWYVRDEGVRGGKGESGLLDMSSKRDPKVGAGGPGWKRDTGRRPWRPR